jgi:hypothetical protein
LLLPKAIAGPSGNGVGNFFDKKVGKSGDLWEKIIILA